MSIATEITRLQNAKASIKTSIENKGVTVPSTTKLDGYPALIDSIPTGSQITVEPLSVTQNGTYQETGKAYSPVTVNVQGGGGGVNNGSDVIFIDYDGTVVASYSKENLEMPANPSHTGLTAQGWNWTQAEIEAQLTAYPNQSVYVGQNYITDDGDTRVYVHFEEERKSPYLGLGVNGTVTIDWGDNTTSTLTGRGVGTAVNIQHLYQTGGDYVIKLTPTSGSFSILGVVNGTHLLKKETSISTYTSRVYANAVQKVELGSNVSIGSYAFYNCCSLTSITIPNSVTAIYADTFYNCYSLASITIPNSVTAININAFYDCYSLASVAIPSSVTIISNNAFDSCSALTSITIPNGATSIGNYVFSGCSALTSITIPSSVTSIGNYAIQYCYSLVSASIPNSVTSIGTYAFRNCFSLVSASIPNSVTSIGTYMFSNCYTLTSITIPSSVTKISANAFSSCYGMAEYHFLCTTPPSLANVNAFTSIPSDCIMYVPYSADHSILEAYQTATNWSTYASYMQEEPQ